MRRSIVRKLGSVALVLAGALVEGANALSLKAHWILVLGLILIAIGGTRGVWQALRPPAERVHNRILADYVKALKQASLDSPYAIVRNRLRAQNRTLMDVYIPQSILARPSADQGRREASLVPTSLEKALNPDRNVLIEGGPGAGKSSLLRAYCLALCESFESRESKLAPVLVRAQRMASGSEAFSSRLLHAAREELGGLLRQDLPDDFFENPPRNDAAWLILLDGLDAIPEEADRTRLLDAIGVQTADRSPYRFVVTSRPAPGLGQELGRSFASFQMVSFGPDQVKEFADRWFSGSEAQIDSFLAAIGESRIPTLASVPLLLTLAAIHLAPRFQQPDSDGGSERSLPETRSGLYESFVHIALEESGRGERRAEIRDAWAARHGRRGEECADQLMSRQGELLRSIARLQQAGDRTGLVSLAVRWGREKDLIPEDWISADELEWTREQIQTLLTRSGIVVREGEGVSFLHDSFQEYLSAKQDLERCPTPNAECSWEIVRDWRALHRREVVLFALGIWSDSKADLSDLVLRIRRSRGLLFASIAIGDGVRVSQDAMNMVARDLRLDIDTVHYPDVDDVDAFAGLSARMGRVDWLVEIASDAQERPRIQLGVARALRRIGQPDQAALVLWSIVRDQHQDVWIRIEAAAELASSAPSEGVNQALVAITQDRQCNSRSRMAAAKVLAETGSSAAATPVFEEIARDQLEFAGDRVVAAKAVLALGHHDDMVAILAQIAHGPHPAHFRLVAALDLAEAGQSVEATQVVEEIAREPATEPRDRLEAAKDLISLHRGEEAKPILETLTRDPTVYMHVRIEAARLLISVPGSQDAVSLLEGIANDLELDSTERIWAATTLVEYGQAESVISALEAIAREADLDYVRVEAAQALTQSSRSEQGILILREIAGDPTRRGYDRVLAATGLAGSGQLEEAADILEGIARDHDDSEASWEAARALGHIGGH